MRLARENFSGFCLPARRWDFFATSLPLVITRESWLTVYCRPGSSRLDDDEFARHATMPHAIPPFRTSLPRIRHANWKSGGAASVCRRNAFTRDRHATTPSLLSRLVKTPQFCVPRLFRGFLPIILSIKSSQCAFERSYSDIQGGIDLEPEE